MSTPNKYCADLQGGMWFQYNTKKKQWFAKPCCIYATQYPVGTDITQDFWHNEKLQKERQDNLLGYELPPDCARCQTTEQNGNYSRRQSWNDRLGTHWQNPASLIELDIQADFSCNLACRICGPTLSTFWRHVVTEEVYANSKQFKVRADNNNVIELLNTVPMHDIQQIHFQGGEPLLSNTHIQVLEKLQDQVDLGQVVVWYHSNATTTVSDAILKFWEKFKMVEIYFSLDDMGPRMEYQRWPAQWSTMEQTLYWFRNNSPHNTLLNIERTIGVLNLAWAQEIDQWHKQYFSHTKYGDPISVNYHPCSGVYSLDALTQEYKDFVINTIPSDHWAHKQVLNASVDNQQKINMMLDHLNTHDKIRNQNWQEIYPEFQSWYRRYL